MLNTMFEYWQAYSEKKNVGLYSYKQAKFLCFFRFDNIEELFELNDYLEKGLVLVEFMFDDVLDMFHELKPEEQKYFLEQLYEDERKLFPFNTDIS